MDTNICSIEFGQISTFLGTFGGFRVTVAYRFHPVIGAFVPRVHIAHVMQSV